jgi:hypothetical protein
MAPDRHRGLAGAGPECSDFGYARILNADFGERFFYELR